MARLGQIIKNLNIGIGTAAEFLKKKGQDIEQNPSVKLTEEQENLLLKEFLSDQKLKEKSDNILQQRLEKEKEKYADTNKEHTPTTKKRTIAPKDTEIETEVEVEAKTETDDTAAIVESFEEEQVAENPIEVTLPQAEIVDKMEIEEKEVEQEMEIVEEKDTTQTKEAEAFEEDKAPAGARAEMEVEPIEIPQSEIELEKEKSKGVEIEPQTEIETESDTEVANSETEEVKGDSEIFKYKSKFAKDPGVKVVGSIDLSSIGKNSYPRPKKSKDGKGNASDKRKHPSDAVARKDDKPSFDKNKQGLKGKTKEPKKVEFIETKVPKLQGTKVVSVVDVENNKNFQSKQEKPADKAAVKGSATDSNNKSKDKKRSRIKDGRVDINNFSEGGDRFYKKDRQRGKTASAIDVNQSVSDTLAKLRGGKSFKKAADYRKEKRENVRIEMERAAAIQSEESKIIKITEFVTANELATMMNVHINDVIKTYMNLGMFVGINQRLDAESINIVAEEFGFSTEFISAEASKTIDEEDEDKPEDLVVRHPIVTVMGHVDHGKTSLLDYIRKTNVIAGEAGGITQHIGAYNVCLENGKHITFLDTPGHEAFTAMRARGTKVTDIAIIIVAADDNVMPQTIEAINHASSAGVPIIFAINKIDKDGADPEKIKASLANMNYQVEDWGGKYQSQDISAKQGIGVNELLEKILLEAEMLNLKSNPKRKATGSVIDFKKDKGRGNVVTLLVESGTLKQGNIVIAGHSYGKIRAMFNEREQQISEAKPSEPAMILGIKGELQAGDRFNVVETEQQAREIISQRDQLKREMRLRTSQHLTLDEIGRRIALGNFQELNLIVKGDVDGSIEALSDSLIKLSTPEIQVNVIHKGVGQINEGDVNLAISSNAIIVGFQVRPTSSAKHLAETESVDIRTYSIIYQAIDEVRSAMEGMLIPEKGEKIVATLEVRNTFHITKIGTIAGCIVKDGNIKRNSRIRVIHDGIVVFTGDIASLKHEKDDVKEAKQGHECGLNVANFNDIVIGDIIEAFEEIEIKKTL